MQQQLNLHNHVVSSSLGAAVLLYALLFVTFHASFSLIISVRHPLYDILASQKKLTINSLVAISEYVFWAPPQVTRAPNIQIRTAQGVPVLCLQSWKLDGTIPPLKITLQSKVCQKVTYLLASGLAIAWWNSFAAQTRFSPGFGLWARSILQAIFRTLAQSQTNAWE